MKTTVLLVTLAACTLTAAAQESLLTGQSAFTNWDQQSPGIRHKITVADLPAPNPSQSVRNQPHLVPRPSKAWPQAPSGFKVTLYAGGDSAPLQRADATEHMQPKRWHIY